MGMYVARHVVSFILFSVALVLLAIGTAMDDWFRNNDYSFGLTDLNKNKQDSLVSGIEGCSYSSLALAALCVLLSFIMMSADCCCHVNKYLRVIPRVNISIATIAGVLAEVACALLIVKITGNKIATVLTINFTPGVSFYLVAAAGILLMVTGCLNCRIRYDTTVEVMETQGQMQSQTQQMTSYGYPVTMTQSMGMSNYNSYF